MLKWYQTVLAGVGVVIGITTGVLLYTNFISTF